MAKTSFIDSDRGFALIKHAMAETGKREWATAQQRAVFEKIILDGEGDKPVLSPQQRSKIISELNEFANMNAIYNALVSRGYVLKQANDDVRKRAAELEKDLA